MGRTLKPEQILGLGLSVVALVLVIVGILLGSPLVAILGILLGIPGLTVLLATSIKSGRRNLAMKDAYVIAVTILLFSTLVLVQAGSLSVFSYSPNVTTQVFGVQGWSGGGDPAFGATAGTNTNGGLIDQTDYMASWSTNGNGQKVTAQGSLFSPTSSLCNTLGAWGYRIILYVPGNTPISGWTIVLPSVPLKTYSDISQVPDANTLASVFTEPTTGFVYSTNRYFNAPAITYNISSPDGSTVIPEGSAVQVQFWVSLGCPLGGSGWYKLAIVDARVHTGIGSSTFDQRIYQPGMTANCVWTVGYLSDPKNGNIWSIFITSTGQGNQTVAGPLTITTYGGALSYLVRPSDVVSGAKGPGLLWCDLRNNLVPKDFDIVGTIANISLSPSLTVTGVSPQTPKQGQPVTVNWTAAPNPVTKSPLAKILVMWGWGSPTTQASLGGNATSYTFVATQAGYVTVVVIAVDQTGAPSASTKLVISVNPQANNGGLGGGGLGNIPSYVTFLAILFLFIGLPSLLIGLYVPGNPAVKGILIIVGIGLTLAGAFFAFTAIVDSLAVWFNLSSLPIKWWK